MATTKKPTAYELALADVATHQETVARWEAVQSTAEVELLDVQVRSGDEVLADPAAAGRLSASMRELRDRIDTAERAVAAARPKLEAAAREAVLAEADDLDAEAARIREQLAVHEARTVELLNQLHEHEGPFVPNERLTLRSVAMEAAARKAEVKAWVLREVAEGRDPQPELMVRTSLVSGLVDGRWLMGDVYSPSVWGPDALLPAPAYRVSTTTAVASAV